MQWVRDFKVPQDAKTRLILERQFCEEMTKGSLDGLVGLIQLWLLDQCGEIEDPTSPDLGDGAYRKVIREDVMNRILKAVTDLEDRIRYINDQLGGNETAPTRF